MIIAHFIATYWLDVLVSLVIFFIVTAQIIPPRFAGSDKYFPDANGNRQETRKQSLLEALMTALIFTLNRSLIVVIGFRGATSLLIFAVVGVELVYNHTVTTNVVILAIVGIIALHFEQLVDQAEDFSVWKIFSWKRRK